MYLVAMTGRSQPMGHEDILDALADLQHDLGKYLVMPLAFLPADAEVEALRHALHKALLQTRQSGTGVHSARDIWRRFVDEMGTSLDGRAAMGALAQRVERALSWEARLEAPSLDRELAFRDLAAVGEAIRRLVEEIEGGDIENER